MCLKDSKNLKIAKGCISWTFLIYDRHKSVEVVSAKNKHETNLHADSAFKLFFFLNCFSIEWKNNRQVVIRLLQCLLVSLICGHVQMFRCHLFQQQIWYLVFDWSTEWLQQSFGTHQSTLYAQSKWAAVSMVMRRVFCNECVPGINVGRTWGQFCRF